MSNAVLDEEAAYTFESLRFVIVSVVRRAVSRMGK